ncbi:Gmad2 immunoglobulin-like domain-containing protein [Haloactinopolyspora sp.]|uniref:Gmad2 immunoglobulin-like domain-containing protein n=1 Tax=Haloactinopolyspora sp. TaxID=1966353 RepID=UPI002631CBF3|nr:Gmad2 immunoglobulin-like domain-containing protein [Haloactinopolyspora sp.]
MNTPHEPDEFSPEEQRLRDALHHAAGQVHPGPDGLAQIRRRTAASIPWWRTPVAVGLAGATVVAAAVIAGGVAVLGDDESPVVTADSTSTPPESTDPMPAESGAATSGNSPTQTEGEPTEQADVRTITVPVYYVVDTPAGLRLTREFREVESAAPAVTTAVAQLGEPPLDPDYRTLWPRGLDVESTQVEDDTIDVVFATMPELEADSSEAARMAAQQLIYTATAAAAMHDAGSATTVQVSVDGEPAAWPQGGPDLADPAGRADPLEVRQLVQIDEPGHGATVANPVAVRGSGAAFEATLQWEVRSDGDVVDSGTVTAEECCTMSPFEFELDLEPGTYEVVVSEIDVSGGEGRAPMSDTKTFTVQ